LTLDQFFISRVVELGVDEGREAYVNPNDSTITNKKKPVLHDPKRHASTTAESKSQQRAAFRCPAINERKTSPEQQTQIKE